MSLEEKHNMHKRIKEWAWFIGLWLGSLVTVLIISYTLKWLIMI